MADQRTQTWDGTLVTLSKMKCRIWSKKVSPMNWNGQECEIFAYDPESKMLAAHIGMKTFSFHISEAVIQVQDKKVSDNDAITAVAPKELLPEEHAIVDTERVSKPVKDAVDAAELLKRHRKKKKKRVVEEIY